MIVPQISKADQQSSFNFAHVSRIKPLVSDWARARRVLVVDDDVDTLEAIRYMVAALSPHEVDCVFVSDPYEAMQCLADEDFDFVLSDFRLPGISGLSLLHQIDHHIDSDPLIADTTRFVDKVPVVLMSAHEITGSAQHQFKNFEITRKLDKRKLPEFLAERKSSAFNVRAS